MDRKYDHWRNHDTGEIEAVEGECLPVTKKRYQNMRAALRATLPSRGDAKTLILHKCGNGLEDDGRVACAAEAHLYLGDASENFADRFDQGEADLVEHQSAAARARTGSQAAADAVADIWRRPGERERRGRSIAKATKATWDGEGEASSRRQLMANTARRTQDRIRMGLQPNRAVQARRGLTDAEAMQRMLVKRFEWVGAQGVWVGL